jgi:hypothetical protein
MSPIKVVSPGLRLVANTGARTNTIGSAPKAGRNAAAARTAAVTTTDATCAPRPVEWTNGILMAPPSAQPRPGRHRADPSGSILRRYCARAMEWVNAAVIGYASACECVSKAN